MVIDGDKSPSNWLQLFLWLMTILADFFKILPTLCRDREYSATSLTLYAYYLSLDRGTIAVYLIQRWA